MTDEIKHPVADVPIEYVDVSYRAPKELHEIAVAIEGLTEDVKAKKELSEIIGGSLKRFMDAVDKFERVSGEARQDIKAFCARTGHMGGNVTGVLLKD